MTDIELVECFNAGDNTCFEEMYVRFGKDLKNTAKYKFSLIREDAEDMLHDFFIHMFKKFEGFDPDKGTVKDFLNKSFSNFVIQKHIRKNTPYFEDVDDLHIEDVKDEVNEYYYKMHNLVTSAFQGEDLEIFHMYLDNKSITSISEQFGIERSKLNRKLKAMEKYLINEQKTSHK